MSLYIKFMKAFRDVVNKCLRMELAEDWEESTLNFSTVLDQMKDAFDTIENVKFHILRVSLPRHKRKILYGLIYQIHVAEAIRELNRPLGQFGEQELEVLHHAWKLMWEERYKVKEIENPVFPSQQEGCFLDFNSSNSGY